jgi:3-oxoacyl-[acyl-carrier protein] reductase
MSVNGKVALVSGASRGIGAEIARQLAQQGAKVVVAYFRGVEPAARLVQEIVERGGEAAAISADLTDASQTRALVDGALAKYGRIDVLVNNAAITETAELGEVTAPHLDRLFRLNVYGLLLLTQTVVRSFGAQGGRVVNISSRNGAHPVATAAAYCGTKAAVNAITVSLAQELGPRGITVNAVAPGPTDTASFRARLTKEGEQFLLDRTPLGRLGTPSDIASIVVFLASDGSRWITGEIISATGGLPA